jgi:hypothetical protein
MLDNSRPDHIQVHIDDTLYEVLISLHCCCVIAIFPEGAFSALPLVVCLSGTPSRQLYTLGDDLSAIPVIEEQMYVVRSCRVIENDKPVSLLLVADITIALSRAAENLMKTPPRWFSVGSRAGLAKFAHS